MNTNLYVQRPMALYSQRQVEGEGVLRMLLLCFALALPLAAMAYLQIQHTRLSYQMSEVRDQIRQEDEAQRTLMLARSRFQRDEEIQAFATTIGLGPRRICHFVPRSFTQEDQRLAKLTPPPQL